MKKELKNRIEEYKKVVHEKLIKANDLDIIVHEISKLPYGQLKKVLTPEVISVLEKYGYKIG